MEVNVFVDDIESVRVVHNPDSPDHRYALELAVRDNGGVLLWSVEPADLWDFACKIQNALHDLGEEESGV